MSVTNKYSSESEKFTARMAALNFAEFLLTKGVITVDHYDEFVESTGIQSTYEGKPEVLASESEL
jgi:hypothetical protein